MNAFIEIIEQLIELIPGQSWLEHSGFPFKNLKKPQGKVFDICLFGVNAQGALGFAWVGFQSTSLFYTLPFRLARHSEDGDLITVTPWSLRDASYDSLFYEGWRSALQQRNPIPTAKGGFLGHNILADNPGIVAIGIWSDARNSCVRLDCQETYKVFRTIELNDHHSREVEILRYLGGQTIFKNYAQLLGIFEYRNAKFNIRSNVAISMRYIKNNGTLFPLIASLIERARFPQRLKERAAKEAWQTLLNLLQSLGRIISDFHKAMTFPSRSTFLAAESYTEETKKLWLETTEKKLFNSVVKVTKILSYYPNFKYLENSLSLMANKILKKIVEIDNLGLKIYIHSDLHLGQIIIGTDGLYLLDYEQNIKYQEEDLQEWQSQDEKHHCLEDVASLILSIRFAWFQSANSIQHPSLISHGVTLAKIEHTFLKFYYNNIRENVANSELLPKEETQTETLLNFYYLLRVLNEIIYDERAGNPRVRSWLEILQECILDLSRRY
ncbi:MAG: hypothetical protein K2X39_01955 [Silvanigrellaceae bacterium]|nr:hypothetical protein [Silvanigrellaceae bacterium]